MRGDHATPLCARNCNSGPPPHARGSRGAWGRSMRRVRPTPACAGITSRSSLLFAVSSAHPRMRGDHLGSALSSVASWGPPPHARGSRDRPRDHGRADGPTPACAGITRPRSGGRCGTRAHPRMRGDHRDAVRCVAADRGPPPHARGSPLRQRHPPLRNRPTPACAGITQRRGTRARTRAAHPRMRGDHRLTSMKPPAAFGPPPHARGSRHPGATAEDEHGPTPACAGITTCPRTSCCS